MTDDKNYELQPKCINRSAGGSCGVRYAQPATEAERKIYFDKRDVD